MKAISEHTGVGMDEITPDGLFSMSEVECLGACVNAPMMQVNNEWVYEVSQQQLSIIFNLISSCRT
jgi:NADH:ubiquinone oxidoreductase subunit E